MKRLIIIPSDPIAAYEHKTGGCNIDKYYNPSCYFSDVFAISPWETEERFSYGMHIIPCDYHSFRYMVLKIKPDVIRAYGGSDACQLACTNKIPGIPVIVSIHDTNPNLLHSSIIYADMVLCMSNAVANLVRSRNVDNTKIRILPNRIDYDVFRPLLSYDLSFIHNLGLPTSGKHILSIGRLSEQKNLKNIIRALQLLPQDYNLLIVGSGEWAPYAALARDLDVYRRCFHFDNILNSNLPILHSWADCFCVPSRWEGFGIVFIEAAACGNPVITSNIAPMNEYLRHNTNAYLIDDYENPHSIAIAIRTVCENTELHKSLEINGRKSVHKFDRQYVDSLEISYYNESTELVKNKHCIQLKHYFYAYFGFYFDTLKHFILKKIPASKFLLIFLKKLRHFFRTAE